MTSTATRIDFDAARERLSAITTDPTLLDGFERVAQKGTVFISVLPNERCFRSNSQVTGAHAAFIEEERGVPDGVVGAVVLRVVGLLVSDSPNEVSL